MKTILLAILAAVALLGTPARAQDVRDVPVKFAPGTRSTTIRNTIKGYQTVHYKLRARAGQSMIVELKTDNGGNYFNILAPGKGPGDEALFTGSLKGLRYEGTLPADGTYTVQVFLMRFAARRHETAHYTLKLQIK